MDKLSKEWYPLPLKIAGIGRYLPGRVISSQELETQYGLEQGWCAANLGVGERRWADDETPSFMGSEAAREAVNNAGIEPEDIDLIINASSTATYERGLPDGGPLLQQRLGLEDSGIPCFSMQNNCLSFMLALDVCATLLITGRYQNILVVSSEIFSFNLDTNNPHVYGLFGDASAAAVITLTPPGETSAIHNVRFETYSSGSTYMHSLLGLASGKMKNLQPGDLTLKMEPGTFMEYAHKYTRSLMEKMFKDQDMSIDDMDLVIPQQVGKAFLDPISQSIPGKKIIRIIDRLGFCGAASLPTALYDAVKQEELQRSNQFLMIGVGAGMSVGAMIITY